MWLLLCRTPAEGHVFAVRKLLDTPEYGCKAVNLGKLSIVWYFDTNNFWSS